MRVCSLEVVYRLGGYVLLSNGKENLMCVWS